MDKLIEKFGLYDFFARLITGLTILVGADFFGIIDWLHPYAGSQTHAVLYLVLGGYFLGILIEELLYWLQYIIGAIKNHKRVFLKIKEPPEMEEKKCKLIGAGHEHLIEAPLIHVVMSGCYVIAFGLFAILCFVRKVGWLVIGPGNQFSDWLNIGILVFVTVVFGFRRYHYRARRIELVDRYYKAYCNEDANKKQTEDQKE